tara:strand:- start:53 stop:448 length:396 start_codon:yes stop_codon:yes gene_type:complete
MSDVILLRKLTEKSTLKFGQFHDVPLYNLLDLNRYTYLRWVYYNSSNITFMDNILFRIGILESEFIIKPGKNPELCETVKLRIRSKMGYKSTKRLEKLTKIGVEKRQREINKKEGIKFSKMSLINRNHGKI